MGRGNNSTSLTTDAKEAARDVKQDAAQALSDAQRQARAAGEQFKDNTVHAKERLQDKGRRIYEQFRGQSESIIQRAQHATESAWETTKHVAEKVERSIPQPWKDKAKALGTDVLQRARPLFEQIVRDLIGVATLGVSGIDEINASFPDESDPQLLASPRGPSAVQKKSSSSNEADLPASETPNTIISNRFTRALVDAWASAKDAATMGGTSAAEVSSALDDESVAADADVSADHEQRVGSKLRNRGRSASEAVRG